MNLSPTRPLQLSIAALVTGLLVVPFATSAQAQGRASSAVLQAESFQQQQDALRPRFHETTVPTLYDSETNDVGPQYVVLPKVKHKWLELSADSQFLYTSNVFLTDKDPVDSTLAVHTLSAGVVSPTWDVPGGQLLVRTGYRHQFFEYGLMTDNVDQLNNIDFDVSTIYSQLKYQFLENWVATVGYDYNRLLNAADDRKEFYVEGLPYWSVDRHFQFGEKGLLDISYLGNYHSTRVTVAPFYVNDRTDQALSFIYSYKLTDKLVVQPYYRFQYTHYDHSITPDKNRNEMLNSLGISLTYFINDWSSVRTFLNYDLRDSSDPAVQDYRKLDTGGGLSVAVSF